MWTTRVAAVLVVGFAGLWMTVALRGPGRAALSRAKTRERARRQDVDKNGTVDIVDAYLMAARIEAGKAPAAWDLDGDGVVDDVDVRMVASAAVALKEEES